MRLPCRGTRAGRTKPDTTQALVKRELLATRHTTISAYPYAYYTPETELAFGAGGIVTFYTSEERILRPSKSTVSAYYTTKKQYKFSLSPQLYFGENTLFISSDLSYGYYVDKFWGIGEDSPETGDEGYTSRAFAFNANVQVKTSEAPVRQHEDGDCLRPPESDHRGQGAEPLPAPTAWPGPTAGSFPASDSIWSGTRATTSSGRRRACSARGRRCSTVRR